jgi:hypothetical protein
MPSPFADTATRRDGRPLTPHPASYFLHAVAENLLKGLTRVGVEGESAVGALA